MPHKEPDDSRIVSVRLPNPLVQRLDRLLDWHTTHRRRPTTRNAAMRNALRDWLNQQEQLTGLLDPQVLRQQFQAAYDSLRPPPDGVPIHRLRRLLRWPRERFDAVLEALRAVQAVDLEALPEPACDDPATQTATMSMANAMTASAGAREQGAGSTGARPGAPALARSARLCGGHLATIAPLTCPHS